MTNSNNEFDYTSSNYLNRVFFSLTALNRISKDELLAIKVFNDALYELLYAATVTGVEEYLQYRLTHEVFASKEAICKYVKTYNYKKKKRIEHHLKEDDEEGIKDSLYNKHVYHQLDIICDYFTKVSNFDVNQCPSWEQMKLIIAKRHAIVHHATRDANNNKIELTPNNVTQAYELARKFINEVEAAFIKAGKEPLIINPDE